MTTEPLLPISAARIFHDGTLSEVRLNHPEGLAVAADGAIWCGGETGEIYRISPDGETLELKASTGGFTLGMAFGPDGELYTCDLGNGSVFKYVPDTGELSVFAEGINIPNYPVVDFERGVLYVSDSHAPDTPGPGVYRFDLATGEGGLWYAEPMVFANGMALSPDRTELYVAETFASRVSAITINQDGSAGEARVVVSGIDRLPDGLAFDTSGRLYIGCYEPSRLYRYADGELRVLIDDPDAHTFCHPTNLAFRDGQLYTANLGRWHITEVSVGEPGLPLG